MGPGIASRRSSAVWRVISTATAVVAISYVLFDVLDLDGSDWPLHAHPLKGNVLVANDLKGLKIFSLAKSLEGHEQISYYFTASQEEFFAPYRTEEAVSSALDSARVHGYRVSLARSSIP